MNRVKKISLITIIFYILFITTVFAETATIEVSAARLREDANATSKVLTNIYKGEKVEILEKNGEWYKVKYGNNTGFLKKDLLKKENDVNTNLKNDSISNKKEENKVVSSYENTTTSNFDSSVVVTSSKTTIRYQPSLMSNVIIELEAGKALTKIVQIGNWIQVSDGTVEGWVLKNKVTQNTTSTKVESSDFESTNTVADNKKDDKSNKNEIKDSVNKTENKVENTTVNKNETSSNTTNNSQVNKVNKKGKVNVETAKVRKSASKTAKVVGFLDYNDEITILEEDGEWYKFTEKNISGYVHNTLVDVVEENISSRGTAEERIEKDNTTVEVNVNDAVSDALSNQVINSEKGNQVVELAKKYLGYKYVVGGKKPDVGFDCSGFTRYVFLQFGYSLGATAAGQNNIGREIQKSELQSGDLILFYDEGKTKIGHTGIYISGGDFIHSANPERGVVIDNINTNSYYNQRYIVAKRIVE